MRLLKNIKEIDHLLEAVHKCEGDVILRHNSGTEEFNLKSRLSSYLAIARLCEEDGDNWEIFCMNRNDERYLLKFFDDIRNVDKVTKSDTFEDCIANGWIYG